MSFSILTENEHENVRGRRPDSEPLSRKDAEILAQSLMAQNRLSKLGYSAISLFATAGILTIRQMNELLTIKPRTLRKYQGEKYHLIRWSYIPDNMPDCFPSKRLEHTYTLAEVGIEVARKRNWCSTHFEQYNHHRAVHDLLCNEVVIRLLKRMQASGIKAEWSGAWESRLYDNDNAPQLEPDSLIRINRNNAPQLFAFEYHNEDDRRRVGDKVERYENEQRGKRWPWQWKTNKFPTVLISYTHPIVARGYIDVLRELGRDQIRCRYLAKSVKNATDDSRDITQWLDVNRAAFSDERVPISLFNT